MLGQSCAARAISDLEEVPPGFCAQPVARCALNILRQIKIACKGPRMASEASGGKLATDLNVLSVTLALRSGLVGGEVVAFELRQTTIDFHPPEMPHLPLSAVVGLEFKTPTLKSPVRLSAMVISRTEIGGCRRYVFEFKLKEGQDATELLRLFNRRTSYRAPVQKPISVNIFPADPAARAEAKPVVADLHDISATGIALLVTPEQDTKVSADNVYIEFELPTCATPLKVLITIRHRVLMPSKAVRYGCAYNPQSRGFLAMEDAVVGYLMKQQQDLLKHRGDPR